MKKIIILLAAIFVLIVGTATGVAIYSNQPKVVARNAIFGAISGFFEREEIEPVIDMLDGGSLELDAEVDTHIFAIEPFSARGKIYFSDEAVALNGFSAKVGEQTFAADAYFSHDLSYVINNDVLGGTYGVVRGRMAETFKKNSFWRNKLLTENQIEELGSLLASYDSGKYEKFEDDIEKYFEKYLKILIKEVEEKATYATSTEKNEADGKQIEVRAVCVSIDENGKREIAQALYDELKNDVGLRELLSGSIGNSFFYEDALKSLENVLNNGQEGDGGAVNIKIITPKLSARLLRIEISDGGESVFTLDAGKKGIKKTDKIAVTLGEEMAFELTVDKKNDTFRLCVPTNNFEISGGIARKGRTLTLTPDYVKLGGVSVRNLDVTLVVKGKDKMPAPLEKDEVKTIFEFPSNDLKNILYKFGMDFPNDNDGTGEGFLGDDDEID